MDSSTNKEIILKLGIIHDAFNERMVGIEVLLGVACGIGVAIAISLIKIAFF